MKKREDTRNQISRNKIFKKEPETQRENFKKTVEAGIRKEREKKAGRGRKKGGI